jgi:hypothetical protein
VVSSLSTTFPTSSRILGEKGTGDIRCPVLLCFSERRNETKEMDRAHVFGCGEKKRKIR